MPSAQREPHTNSSPSRQLRAPPARSFFLTRLFSFLRGFFQARPLSATAQLDPGWEKVEGVPLACSRSGHRAFWQFAPPCCNKWKLALFSSCEYSQAFCDHGELGQVSRDKTLSQPFVVPGATSHILLFILQSAIFDFGSMITVLLLLICTCTYIRGFRTTIFDTEPGVHGGFKGTLWKLSRIGERMSPYISLSLIAVAIHLLFVK
jgi:hypothetical protein